MPAYRSYRDVTAEIARERVIETKEALVDRVGARALYRLPAAATRQDHTTRNSLIS